MAKTTNQSSTAEDFDKRNRTAYNLKMIVTKKLKIIAATKGNDMSDIVEELLESYIVKYEQENGPIPVK